MKHGFLVKKNEIAYLPFEVYLVQRKSIENLEDMIFIEIKSSGAVWNK
jgi:hypothetical protein